jgi:hypothetical protein
MKKLNIKPPKGMKLRHHDWLYLLFCIIIVLFIIVWESVPRLHTVEILIAFLTLVSGVFYFLNQQYIEKARFFKELFSEFNNRYDKKNNKLLAILKTKEPLIEDQKILLIDYFNLCAEEYMFHEAGYIDDRVWYAWCNGMKQFGKDPRISELWQQELKTNSYYGFEFPLN